MYVSEQMPTHTKKEKKKNKPNYFCNILIKLCAYPCYCWFYVCLLFLGLAFVCFVLCHTKEQSESQHGWLLFGVENKWKKKKFGKPNSLVNEAVVVQLNVGSKWILPKNMQTNMGIHIKQYHMDERTLVWVQVNVHAYVYVCNWQLELSAGALRFDHNSLMWFVKCARKCCFRKLIAIVKASCRSRYEWFHGELLATLKHIKIDILCLYVKFLRTFAASQKRTFMQAWQIVTDFYQIL